MDTRRASGPADSHPTAELGTETGPISLVDLVELRGVITMGGSTRLRDLVPALILFAVVSVIATFAIATSRGWSIVMN